MPYAIEVLREQTIREDFCRQPMLVPGLARRVISICLPACAAELEEFR